MKKRLMNDKNIKSQEEAPPEKRVPFAIKNLDALKKLIPTENKINLVSIAKFLSERKDKLAK